MQTSLRGKIAADLLPSRPEVAAEIVEISHRPEPDFDAMIDAIRTDPATAGQFLMTSNSAFMGMCTRASSIEIAVSRLVSINDRTLILSFSPAGYQNQNSFGLRPTYQLLLAEIAVASQVRLFVVHVSVVLAVRDILLQKTADILRDCMRLTDSVIIIGSDEFVILMRDVNADILAVIANQIVGIGRSEADCGDPQQAVSCSRRLVLHESSGSAPVRPDIFSDEADRRMYGAKRGRIDGVCFQGSKTKMHELPVL